MSKELVYMIRTQQGFSQHLTEFNLKDADAIHEIYVRNGIWHTITDPVGKTTVYAKDNSHLFDETGKLKK